MCPLLRVVVFGCMLALVPVGLAQGQDRKPTELQETKQYGCKRMNFAVNGAMAFIIHPPKLPDNGSRPWVWYAPTIGSHPNASNEWVLKRLLDKGFAVVGINVGESYGNPAGRKLFTEFYEHVVKEHKLDAKANLLAQSRGGLMHYNWAAENPDKVRTIVGIYPVCDLRSYPGINRAAGAYGLKPAELEKQLADHNPIDRLTALARAKVPILHIHGDSDRVVPLEANSKTLTDRYTALGGKMHLIVVPKKGHAEIAEFFQEPRIVQFLLDGKVATQLEIIDTHTHFYDPTRKEGVPWPGKNDKILYRPVLPDEFVRLTKPLGVVGTLVVEASPRVEDNQWLLDLAAKNKVIVGVVGRLDPASDDFEKNLRRFAANPLFRGIRINHDAVKAGLKSNLVERCKLLAELGLTLDVNGGPDMPADVAILAAKLPKLRIVINHAANLRIDGMEPPAKWREGMAAAAKCPKVYCKVSALVEQTGQKAAPRELAYYRPVLEALWELFGEDRLVYGSNWPVSSRAAPYEDVVGIVREYFTGKGERAAAKFFQRNSQAAYGGPGSKGMGKSLR